MAKIVEISNGKEVPVEAKKSTSVKTVEKPRGKETVVVSKDGNVTNKKKELLKKLIFPTIAILTLVGIGIFYYFIIYRLKPVHPSEVVLFKENYISSQNPLSPFRFKFPLLPEPKEPKTEVSPLNGLLFSKKEMDVMKGRRPVAVMINNHSEARPQSGLNSADIVYETNAESGITRYLGIFWSNAPAKVGPIRSLRQYYLEWASEYDPLLLRDGCAESTDPKANACGNVYTYGIKDLSTVGAWRWNDGRRFAPHNEYTSITNAWDYAQKKSWNSFPTSIKGDEFKNDAEVKDRGTKTVAKTVFHMRLNNHGAYDGIWTYDSQTNSYFRKIGGSIDVDQETGTQVTAKNIVIQRVRMYGSSDGTARVVIPTIGEGEAVILQDGKIINGTWKKASRTERTMFYDKAGKPIKFNRGRIWIAAIPTSDGKFDIIEQ